MSGLTWSENLGKRVRTGDWLDQSVSTVEKIEDAIEEENPEMAAQLIDYFMEEAKVCHLIYLNWFSSFYEWLIERGASEDKFQEIYELLAFPDGEIFDAQAGVPVDRWSTIGSEAGVVANEIRGGGVESKIAIKRLSSLRESWRQLHDRWVDLLSALMTLAAEKGGEEGLEAMYRDALEPYISERYMVYDLRERSYEETIERNLYTSFEAMRGHLCGPQRRGDIELQEHSDRWELSFDPCASGGRILRGDNVEGTGSRCEPPYSFGVTQDEHDWSWNKKGVCYYCAHCCLALERIPAERWGHPVRVVDPPLYPQDVGGSEEKKCTWTIYKKLEDIPDKVYERIGLKKPTD